VSVFSRLNPQNMGAVNIAIVQGMTVSISVQVNAEKAMYMLARVMHLSRATVLIDSLGRL